MGLLLSETNRTNNKHCMEPITFATIYLEHVWGGRDIERVYLATEPGAARAWKIEELGL
jgi:hypothetical protein